MKKILVIGSGGAGKSTFSRRLSEATGLELIHLDKIYWLPDWTEPERADWLKLLEGELEKDAWIMDGNYGSTLEMRLKKSDAAVFLDFPRSLCVWRVFKRTLIYGGRNRPDMGSGCREKIDLEFIRWIWNFPKKDKLRVENLLNKFAEKVKIIRLRSSREAEEFLKVMGDGDR
ncbi:MAG: hypothetical protein R2747_08450 [Pyrinomonadaceae bacterium]